MTWDELKAFCLSLPSTTWDTPFDEETVVFRVGKKIFALCGTHSRPWKVNLKGDPALNRDLRSSYPEIVPGWHMNKEHWNTVDLEGTLEVGFVHGLIRHSYERVRNSLPKTARVNLG